MIQIKPQEVISVIKATRELSLPHYGTIEVKEYKDKTGKDAVTQIDIDIENYLKKNLNELYPDISFVGEEGGGDRESEAFWLVDPIDGTGCYIRGIPHCTTMLALIYKGQVVFSVIYDFINDVVYHAEKARGAFKDKQPIYVSKKSLARGYIAIKTDQKNSKSKKLVSDIRQYSTIMHTVSAGYEYVLVATGAIEGRIVYDGFGKDYDFAAGSLLVEEAGGVVKNIGKDAYDVMDTNFIAVNPLVAENLVENSIL